VGLEVGGVDHDPVGLARLAGEFGEDAVEHPKPAPADEAVVDGLVRTVIPGRVAPHQPVLDEVDDTRHHPLASTRGTPCDNGKNGSIRRICALVSIHNSLMATPPRCRH
jgi:hypothetical protein